MFASFLSTLAVLGLAVAAPHQLAKRDFTGRTTFYTPGDSNPMTACGIMYEDENVKIAALSMSQFSMDLCNQDVTITYQGKTVTAKIWDGCETCSFGQIDLSPGAMSVLDSNYLVTGQFTASWSIGGGGGGDNNNNNEETTTSEKKPDPTPEPSTSTWTPEPTTSSTPPPVPSTTSSPSPSPTPSSTTTQASSSSALASSLSASGSSLVSSSGLLNATTSATTSINATTTASVATVAIHTGTATIAPDATISVAVEDTGNLVVLNDVVARLGRIIIAAAAA